MGDRLGTLGAVGITFLVTLPFCHWTLITDTVYEKGGKSRFIYLFIYCRTFIGPRKKNAYFEAERTQASKTSFWYTPCFESLKRITIKGLFAIDKEGWSCLASTLLHALLQHWRFQSFQPFGSTLCLAYHPFPTTSKPSSIKSNIFCTNP